MKYNVLGLTNGNCAFSRVLAKSMAIWNILWTQMDSREVDYAAVFMVICSLFPTVKNRLQLDPLTDMEVQISTFQVHKAARVPDSDQTN